MGKIFYAVIIIGVIVSQWKSINDASLPFHTCHEDNHQNNHQKRCLQPLFPPANSNQQRDDDNTNPLLSLELQIYDIVKPLDSSDAKPTNNNQPNQKRDRYRWRVVPSCRSNATVVSAQTTTPPSDTDLAANLQFRLFGSSSSTSSSSSIGKAWMMSSITHRLGTNGNCRLTIPNATRVRSSSSPHQPLRARFVLRRVESSTPSNTTQTTNNTRPGPILSQAYFNLTRNVHNVPYLKYGRQPIVLRLVLDPNPYDPRSPYRTDGYPTIPPDLPPYATHYPPPFFVDGVALRTSSSNQLAPPPLHTTDTAKPPVALRIQLGVISPQRHVLQRQMDLAIHTAHNILQDDTLIDEIRYLISDEHLYRFLLTQIITLLHVWLTYLAFREEVGFYVGKENRNVGGLSPSTAVTRFLCEFIIFLYLCDGGGTSWLVLCSVGSSVLVEGWKMSKVFRLRLSSTTTTTGINNKRGFPFVVLTWRDASTLTGTERRTVDYDSIARTYLSLLLYPLVFGTGIYSYDKYQYTSFYSWTISHLANAVYTFGFVSMCPQLYVNYRLKSVAHLPWKVFLYKVFTTFVDDVFAFLVESPWKYKVMTMRDDVVFLCFLGQAWIYRVDMGRANEFGYVYEEKDVKGEGKEKSGEVMDREGERIEGRCEVVDGITTGREGDGRKVLEQSVGNNETKKE